MTEFSLNSDPNKIRMIRSLANRIFQPRSVAWWVRRAEQAAEIKRTAETVKEADKEGKELSGDYYDMVAKNRMALAKEKK